MPADEPAGTAAGPEIEIFSGPGCTYCAQSRELLDSKGLVYVEYDVADPVHMAEYVRRMPRQRSIPQVFIGGEHIGSYEDLKMLLEQGGP